MKRARKRGGGVLATIATALAVGLALPMAVDARPARAAQSTDRGQAVVTVAFSVTRFTRGGLTSDQIEALVREIVGAVNQARDQVIVRLDAQQAAAAAAAARTTSIEFSEYASFRQDEMALWTFALKVRAQATSMAYDLDVVSDRRAADQIGLALNVQYPIVLATSHDLKMESWYTAFKADYIAANQKIVEKLKPVCTYQGGEPGQRWIYERYHTCTAADGGVSHGIEIRHGNTWVKGPVDLDALMLDAAKNSSWSVARRVLQTVTP